MAPPTSGPRRREVLIGAGVGLAGGALAACTTYGQKPSAATAATGGVEAALAKASDVPVGSGVIVDDIVVTQPARGVFTAMSAVCTHAGCTVNKIVDGVIVCPCHGSKFNLDGSVAEGPATRPLKGRAVAVEGDSIVLLDGRRFE